MKYNNETHMLIMNDIMLFTQVLGIYVFRFYYSAVACFCFLSIRFNVYLKFLSMKENKSYLRWLYILSVMSCYNQISSNTNILFSMLGFCVGGFCHCILSQLTGRIVSHLNVGQLHYMQG